MSTYYVSNTQTKTTSEGLKIGDIIKMICHSFGGNSEYDRSIVKVLQIKGLHTIRVDIIKGYHKGVETDWSIDSMSWGWTRESEWDE